MWTMCQKEARTLWWRHNDHDGVSNHQPHECLLNCLFRRRSKKTSKLRVTGLCVGNSPGPVNSPHKGPVTRKMFPFDDVIMYLVVLGVTIPKQSAHDRNSNFLLWFGTWMVRIPSGLEYRIHCSFDAAILMVWYGIYNFYMHFHLLKYIHETQVSIVILIRNVFKCVTRVA